jgi:hypothetical protein
MPLIGYPNEESPVTLSTDLAPWLRSLLDECAAVKQAAQSAQPELSYEERRNPTVRMMRFRGGGFTR